MSILSVDKIQPIGSGSTVTVNATDTILTNVQAGVVTATSFSGSGANLTNLPAQATIANNADNRVITGGSGVNLNGEANLTFSSSLVVTDGNGTVTTGGNYINLKRTTANTNYINAPLANADLVISADENLLFHTVHTGDFNSTERLRINAAGDILLGTDQATIGCNTADGSDNRSFSLCGGSDASQSRGAIITIYGNEGNDGHSRYGSLYLRSGNTTTGIVSLWTQSNERLRIDSSGRLLLGTTTEGHSNADDLTIATTGNTGITVRSGTGSNGNIFFSDATSGDAEFEGMIFYAHGTNSMRFATAQTERLVIDSDGGMELTPSKNSGNNGFTITPANGTTASSFQVLGNNNAGADGRNGCATFIDVNYYAEGSTIFSLAGRGTNRLSVLGSGNVEVNSGNVRVGVDEFDGTGDSDTTKFQISSTTNEVYALALTERGGQCLALATRIDGAGSSTNSVRFFDGPGFASVATINVSASTVTYGTGSDYRMKENQVDISDGITRVKQLKPYRFNWKSEYGGGDKVDGFFAHETSTVVPEAVQGTKDAVDSDGNIIRQQIDQAKLVPVLTAALKEAITKIETLETKVAALESS